MTRLSAALVACALAAAAQEPGAIAVIDAVALDAAGHPVSGLTAADFEITAGGKSGPPIRLTAFDTVRHTAVTTTAQPAVELTPDQIHRTTVIVVDDLCLPAAEVRQTRARLHHFVDDLMTPGDQAAILRTSGGAARSRQITADRAQLADAIGAVEYLGGSVLPQSCAAAAWTAVAYATTGLAPIPGRKAIVLMSGELRAPSGNAATEVIRLAAASMTAIYQTSGVAPAFAASTGGAAGVDLDHVVAETAGFYVLSFTAAGPEAQWKVRRPGVTLRIRGQPAALPPPPPFPAPNTESEEVLDALNSPFDGAAIGVRVTPIFFNNPNEGPVVEVACHIEARDLSYLRDAQGRYHLSFQVGADSVIEAGRAARVVMRQQDLHLTAEEYRRAVEDGLAVALRLSWGAGPRDVRVLVADSRSGRMGSASAFAQVYNLSSGVFFLSGIAAQAGTVVRQSPFVRAFRGGADIALVYNIYNAKVDPEGHSRVQVQTRLVAGGRETFAGGTSTITFDLSRDPVRRQVTSHVHLDPLISPGRYIIQVTATDLLSPEPRAAGQYIDFTVE